MKVERFSEEQVALLGPIVGMLLTMMGAARDAFNRHNRTRLQELRSLQTKVAWDVQDLGREMKLSIARKPEDERPFVIQARDILDHLGSSGITSAGVRTQSSRKSGAQSCSRIRP